MNKEKKPDMVITSGQMCPHLPDGTSVNWDGEKWVPLPKLEVFGWNYSGSKKSRRVKKDDA